MLWSGKNIRICIRMERYYVLECIVYHMGTTNTSDHAGTSSTDNLFNKLESDMVIMEDGLYEYHKIGSFKRVNREVSEESTHSQNAKELLQNPSSIHSIIEDYKGGGEAYSKIIGSLSKGSFDDFMTLQKLFVKANYDEVNRVRSWIEHGLARSIKNSIINSNSTFPVTTLVDVKNRLQVYRDIGVEVPTIHETIETTIEALYDNEWKDGLSIVEGLLYDVPDESLHSEEDIELVIDLLIRLRTALQVETAIENGTLTKRTVSNAIRKYVSLTSQPLIPNRKIDGELSDKSISEILDIAEKKSYEDVIKSRLYGYICHRDENCTQAFVEYLYLTGRSIVEDQRHGMEKPTRARLGLAEKQFKAVNKLSELGIVERSDREQAWSKSHYYVSRGALKASGWIESQRENLPKPDFEGAATEYVHASACIVDYVPVRAMKYRSKALRYAAKRTPHSSAIEIHKKTVEYLINSAIEVDETYFTSSVQDRIRYHTFQRFSHELELAYKNRNYMEVNLLYHECMSMADSIKIPMKTHQIEQKHFTAQAKRAELDGDYETAFAAYDQINKSNTFIGNRKTMIEMKKLIKQDEIEQAVAKGNELKGTHKIIKDALSVLVGEYPENGFELESQLNTIPLPNVKESQVNKQRVSDHVIKKQLKTDNFAGLQDENVSKLFTAVKNAVTAPVCERELFRQEVKKQLLNL